MDAEPILAGGHKESLSAYFFYQVSLKGLKNSFSFAFLESQKILNTIWRPECCFLELRLTKSNSRLKVRLCGHGINCALGLGSVPDELKTFHHLLGILQMGWH